jgi:4-amino-4-deoxychorismate lyase
MSQFFETIRLENGQFSHLEFHLERVARTQIHHFDEADFDVSLLFNVIPNASEGICRVRVDYGQKIENIAVYPYEVKDHHTLDLVEIEDFDYSFKYTDRSFFEQELKRRAGVSDLIFVKEGYLTDTTYCNILLFDGERWLTPHTPLLRGTKRSYLLQTKQIFEKAIPASDITSYRKIAFINAMRDFEKVYLFSKEADRLYLTRDTIE